MPEKIKNSIAKILCNTKWSVTEKEVKSSKSIAGILHFSNLKKKKLTRAFVIIKSGCSGVFQDCDIA